MQGKDEMRMKNVLKTGLRTLGVMLMLLAAVFAGSAAAGADAAPALQAASDPAFTQLQLGASSYSVKIPSSYRNGEVTIEEVQANQVAYYFSPDSDMDFDIYQFPKPNPEMSLEAFTKKTAADFNGHDAGTQTINGIEVTVSRYDTMGLPVLAMHLNSRLRRSTSISRWSSPMPERIVCPVSSSSRTWQVGSSAASAFIDSTSL